jgi:hypothetical protein
MSVGEGIHRPRVYRGADGIWQVSCGDDVIGWFRDWWPAMLNALSHVERYGTDLA